MKGYKIGDYLVGKQIGSGSFGVVHEGLNTVTNEVIAIKIDLSGRIKKSVDGSNKNLDKIINVDGKNDLNFEDKIVNVEEKILNTDNIRELDDLNNRDLNKDNLDKDNLDENNLDENNLNKNIPNKHDLNKNDLNKNDLNKNDLNKNILNKNILNKNITNIDLNKEVNLNTNNLKSTNNTNNLKSTNTNANNSMNILKSSNKKSSNSQLKNEFKTYSDLNGLFGIPHPIFYGQKDNLEFLIMPRFYKNFGEILKNPPPILGESSVAALGAILVEILRGIHGRGRIYRDLKPENVMVDFNDNVFLVDFGLSKYFVDQATKSHIKISQGNDLCGTARYASLNVHAGTEQSRRDDLISLFYVLVFLAKGLPWAGVCRATGKDAYSSIGELKKNTKVDELCREMKKSENYVLFYKHVSRLGFSDTPDYAYLIGLLENVCGNSSGWLVEKYFRERRRKDWIEKIVDFFIE